MAGAARRALSILAAAVGVGWPGLPALGQWLPSASETEPLRYADLAAAVDAAVPGLPPATWEPIDAVWIGWLDSEEQARLGPYLRAAQRDPRRTGFTPEAVRGSWKLNAPLFAASLERVRALSDGVTAVLPAPTVEAQRRLATAIEWIGLESAAPRRFWTARFPPALVAIRSLPVAPSDRVTLDAVLDELDARLLALERKRIERIPAVAFERLDVEQELRASRPSNDDEALTRAWFEERAARLRSAFEPVISLELAALGHFDQAIDRLAGSLSPLGRRQVLETVIAIRYEEMSVQPDKEFAWLIRQLRRRSVSDAARAAAMDEIERWRSADDELLKGILAGLRRWESARRAVRLRLGTGDRSEADRLEQEAWERMHARLQLAAAAASAARNAAGIAEDAAPVEEGELIDLPRRGSLKGFAVPLSRAEDPSPTEEASEDEAHDDSSGPTSGNDWLRPCPTPADIARLAERRSWGPDLQAAAESLQSDLAARWDAALRPIGDQVDVARASARDEEGKPVDLDAPAKEERLWRTAMAELERLEAEFVASLMAITAEADRTALRSWAMARQIGDPVHFVRRRNQLPGPGTGVGAVRRNGNVAWAALAAELSPDDRAAAEAIIAGTGGALVVADASLDDAELRFARVWSEGDLLVDQFEAMPDGDESARRAAWSARQERIDAASARLDRAARTRLAAERDLAAALEAQLSPPGWAMVQAVHGRTLFPGIDDGERRLEGLIQAAERSFTAPGDETRRTLLVALAERWRAEEDRCVAALLALGAEPLPPELPGGIDPLEHEVRVTWFSRRRGSAAEMLGLGLKRLRASPPGADQPAASP